MPSKYTSGNSPLGRRIRNKNSPVSGFAQVEREIGRAQSTPNLITRSRQLPNGTVQLPAKGGTAAASSECILGRIQSDPANSSGDVVKYKLSPGFVTGGGGSELVQPDDLTATIGDFVWLEVAWTGIFDIGSSTVQPGGTMGEITVQQGAEVPVDTYPDAESEECTAHIVLGGWISDGTDPPDGPNPSWVSQGCGAIQLYFCPGNGFFFGRNNEVQG